MKLAVLGAAESGVGAAILAQQKGYDVFVSDMGTIRPHYKEMLDAHHLAWEEGKHTPERLLDADEVVKSPGIPDDAPMVVALREKNIPILSELEFAARYTNAKMLCITGSNGKTTTTSLIYHILQSAGFNVGLAGNIGRSLALQVAEIEEKSDRDWYVLEISSFQLDNMYDFRANIAVLLNITPDHLDRYNFEMMRYVRSKMRITQNQTADGNDSYGFAEGAQLKIEQPRPFEIALSQLSLPGKHNLRNCLSAALAALAAGVDETTLTRCLSDFPGVPHRLERVGTFHGVNYINDSKATNVDACFVALDAQTTPVVLIVGGLDKGNDYTTLFPLITSKCRALVFLGANNAPLHEVFDTLCAEHSIAIADTDSMEDCVAACAKLAQEGDTVLLSPCCASFDLFKNMGDRGDQFKNLVRQR